MIRSIVILLALSLLPLFGGCSEEPYRIEDSVCGKFLESHPDIVKEYQYISCFDSTHAVYQLMYLEDMAFLANVQGNQFRTRQQIVYGYQGKIVFIDLDKIKSDALKEIYRPVDRSDSIEASYSYKPLKKVLMETEGLSDVAFERKFKSDDTLHAIMNRLKRSIFLPQRFSLVRKNDSTFYVAGGRWGYPNRVSLFSRDGGKIKDLFEYQLITNCFEAPPIYNIRPIGTDSTFSMKFTYVREEENEKEYEGFVSLDLKNDSLLYGSEDTLTLFHIAHYKTNGDTTVIMQEFKEDDNKKSKPRKCIGHIL